jgi:hypothetical protein
MHRITSKPKVTLPRATPPVKGNREDAAGPKYKLSCDPGRTLEHGIIERPICTSTENPTPRFPKVRRTSAWERVSYSIVGSDDTRG